MNSPRLSFAFEYAAILHAADVRNGTTIPYLSHLLDVCAIVLRHGGNEDAAIGALQHDAAEDHGGEPRLEDIRQNVGEHVERIVLEGTDTTKHPKPPWGVAGPPASWQTVTSPRPCRTRGPVVRLEQP